MSVAFAASEWEHPGDVFAHDAWSGETARLTELNDAYLAEREYVGETNAFLTGGSFGGFMTAWTVGQTDFFRAAVSQRGVYDLTGFYGSTDGLSAGEETDENTEADARDNRESE